MNDDDETCDFKRYPVIGSLKRTLENLNNLNYLNSKMDNKNGILVVGVYHKKKNRF